MITLNVQNLDALQRRLEVLAPVKRNGAVAAALNITAFAVRKAEQEEMRRVFDRPTPFVLWSLSVTKATADTLTAVVSSKDIGGSRYSGSATRWDIMIAPHVFGGNRQYKSMERRLQYVGILPTGWYIVPGQAMPLNAYGNIKPSEIVKILSWLNALLQYSQGAMQNRNEKVRNRMNQTERAGAAYFATSPIYNANAGLRAGVYLRTRTGQIKPMLIFVNRVQYKAILDWEGVARRTVNEILPNATEKAIRKAMHL